MQRVGMFHSQYSELCGKDHAFLPISVRVVNDNDFTTWVNAAKLAEYAWRGERSAERIGGQAGAPSQ